jgi:hypothetical protein
MRAFKHILPEPGTKVHIIPIKEKGEVKICRRDNKGEIIIEVVRDSDGKAHLCREKDFKMNTTRGCEISKDGKHHWVMSKMRNPFTNRMRKTYYCTCCHEKRYRRPYTRQRQSLKKYQIREMVKIEQMKCLEDKLIEQDDKIKNLQLLIIAAKHLLLACSGGPRDCPVSWSQTYYRWLEIVKEEGIE